MNGYNEHMARRSDWHSGFIRGCAIGLVAVALSGVAVARNPSDHFVHWGYSAYFGTGWYQVGDAQDVFVLRPAPRWRWGQPGIDDDGRRNLGIEFRLPVTFGLNQLNADELSDILDSDNFGTVSVTPGIEVEIPITERWSLKPLAYLGWGTELNDPQSAWIYWAGLKSRYRLGNGKLNWSLVNSLEYIGYTPTDGPSSDAVPVMAGLEFQWPMGDKRLGGQPLYLDWHATYRAYLDNLNFVFGGGSTTKIADEWELGLAFSKGEGKLKLWHFELDRIGLAYRFSSSGAFEGVSLVFTSVFDR